jgi:predicted P-loop ATPase
MLLQTPALVGCIAFDAFAMAVMIVRPFPGDTAWSKPRRADDDDIARLQDFLQLNSQMSHVGREACLQGIEHVARLNSYHPVRRYLESLQWGGVPRLDTWAYVYLGTEDTEYTRAAGRMWLLSAVARLYEPGCQCDYILILEGDQGDQKSEVFRTLASPEWFSDQPLNLKDDARAVSQHLTGNWIIEIAELQSIKGAALETVKAFITRRIEKYLRRFARTESVEQRQCVFGGTTNEPIYLFDATGNRRSWPLKTAVTHPIDIAALAADRDQLFAETLVRYRDGEAWWPDRETEQRLFKPEQDARYDDDSWAQFIVPFLNDLIEIKRHEQKLWDDCFSNGVPTPTATRPVPRVATGEVYRKALASPAGITSGEPTRESFDRTAQLKVRAILLKAGWQVTGKSNGSWWWEYRK